MQKSCNGFTDYVLKYYSICTTYLTCILNEWNITLLSVLNEEQVISTEGDVSIKNQDGLESKEVFIGVLKLMPTGNNHLMFLDCLNENDTLRKYTSIKGVSDDNIITERKQNRIRKFSISYPPVFPNSDHSPLGSYCIYPMPISLPLSIPHFIESEYSVLTIYQNSLIKYYISLPSTSTKNWCEIDQKFTDVTIYIQQKKKHNLYSSSPAEIINRESEHSSQICKSYDDMFFIYDDRIKQLILIEGDAGTGKTTFAYKICKDWATGHRLSMYFFVILINLRDVKPGTVLTPKDLFATMEGMAEDIYTKILKHNDIELLIWLEGWDELDNTYLGQSVFTDLLSNRILPQATVVVSTRPSATASMKQYQFTHTFKLQGFDKQQIEHCVKEYFSTHHQSDDACSLSKSFLTKIRTVHCLLELAEVPLNLAILLRIFEVDNMTLPSTLTRLYHDILLVILQYHKERHYPTDKKSIKSLDDLCLPSRMREILAGMEKLSYTYFSTQNFLSEEMIFPAIFKSQDEQDFDGMGLFEIQKRPYVTGESKYYIYRFKVFQEFLAALFLSRLDTVKLTEELVDIFGDIKYEWVWIFFSGLTKLKRVTIKSVLAKLPSSKKIAKEFDLPVKTHKELIERWKQCHSHFKSMTTSNEFSADFLLILMLCCYEAQNPEACITVASYFYPDEFCRIEIPHNRATPYLFLAVSYFIMHSGKKWSLRCGVAIQSSGELLSKTIQEYKTSYKHETFSCLWVMCTVVTESDIAAYCAVVRSQPSLQWIHLLHGSFLGNDGTFELCECLKNNHSVITLEVDDCRIGGAGLKSIANMLNINNRLICLNLKKNCFNLDDVVEFLHRIEKQLNLQYLLLDKVYCEDPNTVSILKRINFFRKKHSVTIDLIIDDKFPKF